MACAYAKYTGQARRLPGHLGAGRPPPAQRPLRRQARRPAGAGDHRPSLPRPDRHPRAAGRRPRPRLRGRGGLQRAGHGAGARRERGRPGLPHRAGLPRRRAHHLPGRPPGAGGRAQRSKRNVPHHTSDVFARGGALPAEEDLAARRRVLNAGRRSRSWPAAARSGRPTSSSETAETLGAPIVKAAARQGRRAGRQPLHHRRHRPARHAPVAGGDGGLRHAADGRHVVPLHRVLPQAGPGARRPDRPRPGAHRPALPGRGRPGRRQPAHAAGAAAAAAAQRGPRLPREGAGGDAGVVGADGGARHAAGHADEAAGRRLGAGQAPGATTPSSPATPARSPPGWRARSAPGAGRCSRSRARSPRWPAACPTPSPPRSPIPTASASPSSATAASRC